MAKDEDFEREEGRLKLNRKRLGVPELDPWIEEYERATRYLAWQKTTQLRPNLYSDQEDVVELPTGPQEEWQVEFHALYLAGLMWQMEKQQTYIVFPPPDMPSLYALRDHLYKTGELHECSERCTFIQLEPGQLYYSVLMARAMTARGDMFVCLQTGRKHHCTMERCRGKVSRMEWNSCPISGMSKSIQHLEIGGQMWTQMAFPRKRGEVADWGNLAKPKETDASETAVDLGDEVPDEDDQATEEEPQLVSMDEPPSDTYAEANEDIKPSYTKRRRIAIMEQPVNRLKHTIKRHLSNIKEQAALTQDLISLLNENRESHLDKRSVQYVNQKIRLYAEIILYYWRLLAPLLHHKKSRTPLEWSKECRYFGLTMLTMLRDGDRRFALFGKDLAITQLHLLREDRANGVFSYCSQINDTIRRQLSNTNLMANLQGEVARTEAFKASKRFLYQE